jgi:hypothetical protein
MHSHSDKKIKTCPVCQKALRKIAEAGKKLDRLGVWNIPKKIKSNTEYTIWSNRNLKTTK